MRSSSHSPRTSWGLHPGDPATEVEVRASFFPYGWTRSDDVQISFGWQRAAITDAELKRDPRSSVDVVAPPSTQTGVAFRVADLPAHGITLEAVALAEPDTEVRRQGRWKVKPDVAVALPKHFLPLASGQQHGVLQE